MKKNQRCENSEKNCPKCYFTSERRRKRKKIIHNSRDNDSKKSKTCKKNFFVEDSCTASKVNKNSYLQKILFFKIVGTAWNADYICFTSYQVLDILIKKMKSINFDLLVFIVEP